MPSTNIFDSSTPQVSNTRVVNGVCHISLRTGMYVLSFAINQYHIDRYRYESFLLSVVSRRIQYVQQGIALSITGGINSMYL